MPKTASQRRRDLRQVALILDAADAELISGMAEAMHLSAAEVTRQFVRQGIVAARAASTAQRAGADPNKAAIDAVQYTAIEEGVIMALVDAINDRLDGLADTGRAREAVEVARDASAAFKRWADLVAEDHGVAVAGVE